MVPGWGGSGRSLRRIARRCPDARRQRVAVVVDDRIARGDQHRGLLVGQLVVHPGNLWRRPEIPVAPGRRQLHDRGRRLGRFDDEARRCSIVS